MDFAAELKKLLDESENKLGEPFENTFGEPFGSMLGEPFENTLVEPFGNTLGEPFDNKVAEHFDGATQGQAALLDGITKMEASISQRRDSSFKTEASVSKLFDRCLEFEAGISQQLDRNFETETGISQQLDRNFETETGISQHLERDLKLGADIARQLERILKTESDISLQIEEIYDIVKDADENAKEVKSAEKRESKLLGGLIELNDLLDDVINSSQFEDNIHSEVIIAKMGEILGECGLEKYESLNRQFDHRFHTVISAEYSDAPVETITRVLEDGYVYREKVIRRAAVIISKGSRKDDNWN